MSNSKRDRNPTRGQASIFDKLHTALFFLVGIPVSVLQVSWRRLFHESKLSFKDDLSRNIIRLASGHVPLSVKRMLLTVKDTRNISNSARFKAVSGPLCEEVVEENLAGYWICRGLKRTLAPSECDLVVLYVHGGAFVLGHGLLPAASHLRICEIAEEHGITLAIFSVNYTLAPEAKFPTQQDEVIEAYKYLLQREKVDPSRIVISGQSSGGWLSLSVLQALDAQQLPRPAAAWLLYPWVDLTNSGASFERNQYLDTLTKHSLDRSAGYFVGNSQSAVMDYSKVNDLHSILPKYTWVTVGTYDAFYDSIHAFVKAAKADDADVDIVDYEGGTHAWDATIDRLDAQAYLDLEPGVDPGKLMPGASHMANGLLQVYRKILK